ncbi:MAG: branched-chain amino acid ABC transporter permease [Candidatus Hodarchaeales archaeon]|jgi:branched-chain amino acid transport system permease protein
MTSNIDSKDLPEKDKSGLILKMQDHSELIIGLILAVPILLLFLYALSSLETKTSWLIGTLVAIIVFFIGAISLDLEVGSMGLPNFGKVAFFALGANISTILYIEYNVNFVVAAVIALAVSSLMGYIIAIPTVKLRADYFAIMTIAGGEIIRLILQNESRWLWSTSQDGTKSQVITNTLRTEFQLHTPPLNLRVAEFLDSSILSDIGSFLTDLARELPIPIISDIIFLFGSVISDLESVFLWEIAFLLVFCLFAIFSYWFVQQIRKSPYGRTLRAIREDDISVTSVGKNVARFRSQVTTASAFLAGLAGILYGLTFSSWEAGEFRPFLTFNLYIFIIVGGLGNSKGAFLGTSLITMFTRATQAETVKQLVNIHIGPTDPIWGPIARILRVDVFINPESAAIVILGMILILFLLFKPAGLIPEPKTDTEKYLSLLSPEERQRSDEAVKARQSLTEKERISETDKKEQLI